MPIVSGWAAAAMICVAAPEPGMVTMSRRMTRLETIMSTEKLPGDEPEPCPSDDEDPDVPVANGSGGNGPPPPPPKRD